MPFPSYMNQDFLGQIRQNNQNSHHPVATDSVRNLQSDFLGNISATDIYDTSTRLEFPLTLGTDKHTHMMVFHIYNDIHAGVENLTPDVLETVESAEGKIFTGNLAGVGAGAVGGYMGTRALTGLAKGRLGKWGTLANLFGMGSAAVLGYHAGGAIAENVSLTEEEAAGLQTYADATDAVTEAQQAYENKVFNETGRLARFGEARTKQKDTIALYMPQKVQSLSLVEYEQQDLSFMQNILNTWEGLAAKTLIQKAPRVVDSIAGFIGLNTNIDAYLMAGARIMPNPRKQLMFREPISRKFEFNFNFSPRNEEESVRAYEIIKAFKKHAYPTLNKSKGQGAFYNFPAEFEIEYQTVNEYGEVVENDWINRIGRCALREINVDYASAGSFSTFKSTGAPTNMIVSLTFEEMTLLDSELIEQGY